MTTPGPMQWYIPECWTRHIIETFGLQAKGGEMSTRKPKTKKRETIAELKGQRDHYQQQAIAYRLRAEQAERQCNEQSEMIAHHTELLNHCEVHPKGFAETMAQGYIKQIEQLKKRLARKRR